MEHRKFRRMVLDMPVSIYEKNKLTGFFRICELSRQGISVALDPAVSLTQRFVEFKFSVPESGTLNTYLIKSYRIHKSGRRAGFMFVDDLQEKYPELLRYLEKQASQSPQPPHCSAA